MFILYFSDQTGFTGQVCFNTSSGSDVLGRKVWDEYENCKKGLIWYPGEKNKPYKYKHKVSIKCMWVAWKVEMRGYRGHVLSL